MGSVERLYWLLKARYWPTGGIHTPWLKRALQAIVVALVACGLGAACYICMLCFLALQYMGS